MVTYTAVLKNGKTLLNDGFNGDQRFLNPGEFEFRPGAIYECHVASSPLVTSINHELIVGYAIEASEAPAEDPSDVFVLLNDKLHLISCAHQLWLVTNPSKDMKTLH
jgi:hypothetical protein